MLLELSRKNCHGLGLHSIVLEKKPDGRLIRFFMTDPTHKMYLNDNIETASLGVHDHIYPISLMPLHGEVINLTFEKSEFGTTVNHFEFDSILQGGTGAKWVGQAKLACSSMQRLTYSLYLKANQLHTVYVPKGKIAAWIVIEGEKEKDVNNLYSVNSSVDCSAGYDKFESEQEIRDLVFDLIGIKL